MARPTPPLDLADLATLPIFAEPVTGEHTEQDPLHAHAPSPAPLAPAPAPAPVRVVLTSSASAEATALPSALPSRQGSVRGAPPAPGQDQAPRRPVPTPSPVPAESTRPAAAALPAVSLSSAGSVAPTSSSAAGEEAGGRDVDWALVAAFRAQASEQLTATVGARSLAGDPVTERERGREIVQEMMQAAAADEQIAGGAPWSRSYQEAMARAVFDALFGLGRLQPLVDDDAVENITIAGHDNVTLERTDGSQVPGPPVADSDAELIDFLSFIASRSEGNARAFSPARPSLHMRIDGGSRLAATAWVTPRPSVVIRRHRLQRVSLQDLVERETLSPVMATFLAAAVRARKSIVVTGAQGAGKTTLVRALCGQIPAGEFIGTFETEYELFLDQMPGRAGSVHAWEARPGFGEIGPDGRPAGEFTLDQALYDSFRFNLSRQIVGEVRGKEVFAMIKAMESGAGSISTTHAANADAAMRKLVTCAMEAGPHITRELATSKLAETIDLVVHVHLDQRPDAEGRAQRARWVHQILAITPGEAAKGYATTTVFAPTGHGPASPATLPETLIDLDAHGFDRAGFEAAAAGAPR